LIEADETRGGAPLDGHLVLDASRMLPGAVLARLLIDLGARLIKIEEPAHGEPMRDVPPRVGGLGAGFNAFFRGAESVCLDLRRAAGAAVLRRLARRADVLVESFRPGTLEGWGLGARRLTAVNPALIVCSLSGFGRRGPHASRVGHDVNFGALSGLLSLFPEGRIPPVQIADVTAGLLAGTAVLAALVERARTGRGRIIDQPVVSGTLPFLVWPLADAAAGGESVVGPLLGGGCPAYRLYDCSDGKAVAVGALEPKFWCVLVELLGLPELEASGLDTGAAGRAAARAVQSRFEKHPRDHWLALADDRGLPVTAVQDLDEALGPGGLEGAGLLEKTPTPGGGSLAGSGPFIPSAATPATRPAPRLGQHTNAILEEFGVGSDG
jgi:crotonobetainyl-CoA:carnitine CoA-transferase CaiB-like acyl-CoA transferase